MADVNCTMTSPQIQFRDYQPVTLNTIPCLGQQCWVSLEGSRTYLLCNQGIFLAFLLTALPSGQVEAVQRPQGYAASLPSAGQPLGCVARRFLSMAVLPWPWSCLGRTAGLHSFVLNLCVAFPNFLRMKSHGEVLRSVEDVTTWQSESVLVCHFASRGSCVLDAAVGALRTTHFFLWSTAFPYFSPSFLWVYLFCAAIPKCATETWTLHGQKSVVCLYFEIEQNGLSSSKYFIIYIQCSLAIPRGREQARVDCYDHDSKCLDQPKEKETTFLADP